MKRNVKLKCLLLYSIAWIVCAIIIFIPFISGRKSLVITDDGFTQCYPALKYLGEWYKSILRGEVRLFDFTIGYGDDVIGNMSWYGFGDILLIPFCFSPIQYLELSYTLSILFRLYLAGIAFIGALDVQIDDWAKVAGAIIYSFCPYVFKYSFIFLVFSTPMVWIPVIIAGIKEMFYGRKRYSVKLFLGLFFLAITGFYFTYMVIIISAAYMLINVLFEIIFHSYSKGTIKSILSVIVCFALAIISACFVLLPLVIHFFQSPRIGSVSFSLKDMLGIGKYWKYYGERFILPSFSQIENNGKNYDILFIPVISIVTLICVCFLIHHNNTIKKYKMVAVAILSMLALCCNGITVVMNAFSNVYFRYHIFVFFIFAYITSFVLMYIRLKWDNIDTLYSLIIIAVTAFFLMGSQKADNAYGVALVYLVLSILFILSCIKKLPIWVVSTITIAFCSFYGYVYNAPFEVGGRGFCGATYWLHGAKNEIEGTTLYSAIDKDDVPDGIADFSRFDINGKALNASLMLRIPTTYSYYSICNGNILNFLSEYAVSPAIKGSFIYQGLDNRQSLESLFSVDKFSIENSDVIMRNSYKYPMGIGYDTVISEEQIEKMSPIEKQTYLSRTLVVGNSDINVLQDSDIEISLHDDRDTFDVYELPISYYLVGDIVYDKHKIETKAGSKMIFDFSGGTKKLIPERGTLDEIYIVLLDFYSDEKNDIQVGNKSVRIMPKQEENYLGTYDRYINISSLSNSGRVEISFSDKGLFHCSGIKVMRVLDYDYEDNYKTLLDYSLKNAKISNDRIAGNTDFDKDVIMLFSIPYSEGWKAFIDGSESKVFKVNKGLIAVVIPKGNHECEIKYFTPGLKAGLIISLGGLLLNFMVIIRTRLTGMYD